MTMHAIKAAFENAVADLLSENRYAAGRRDYFGVRVEFPGEREHEFELTITFRRGERYCCAEYVCHLAPSEAWWWKRLRNLLSERGIRDLPPLTIVELRVVVEGGAFLGMTRPQDRSPLQPSPGYATTDGPFAEALAV